MWLSTVDRFLHHDSGEKDLTGKEKRPRRRVQENSASLEPESSSQGFPLAHPLQSDPVQPGNCVLCCKVVQCVHKLMGVLILHMETECVLCTLKDRVFLKIHGINTLHSAHSLVRQRLGNRQQQSIDRSETVERLHGQ